MILAKVKASNFNHEDVKEFSSTTSNIASGLSAVNEIATAVFDEGRERVGNIDLNVTNVAAGAASTTTGVFTIAVGKQIATMAHQTGDVKECAQALVKTTLQGPLEVTTGIVNTTHAGLKIAATSRPSSLQENMMKGLTIAALTGNVLCSTILGGNTLANIVEIREHSHDLQRELKAGGEVAGFQYLKQMLTVTTEDKQTILENLFQPKKEEPWYKRAMHYIAEKLLGEKESEEEKEIKQALSILSKNSAPMKKILASKEVDIEALAFSQEEVSVENYLRGVFKNYKKLKPLERRKLLTLVLRVYHHEVALCEKRKEAIFARTVGSKTRQLITPFLKGEKPAIPQNLKEVMTSAKKELSSNMIQQSAILLACMISITVGVVLQAMGGGLYFAAQLALNLVVALIWISIDMYGVYKSYAAQDKNLLNRVAIMMAAMGMIIVSATVSALGNSTANLAATVAITATWLFLLLYGMYRLKKSSKFSHPKFQPCKV
jgi:hypothetical protein